MCFHFNRVKRCFIESSEKSPHVSVKFFLRIWHVFITCSLGCKLKLHVTQVDGNTASVVTEIKDGQNLFLINC